MKISVWMEGFNIQGGQSTAHKVGEVEANSFQEACDYFFRHSPSYDRDRLSDWGCRLFDNEADAKKVFG